MVQEERLARCGSHATKIVDAVSRGMIEYRARCSDKDLANPNSLPSRLLEVWQEMLTDRGRMVARLATHLYSAESVDQYPAKLLWFLETFIQHPSLDLPRSLAKTCKVNTAWFEQWAKDAHAGGGVDANFGEGRLPRTGLLMATEDLLQNLHEIDELIPIFERGIMYFFKHVIRSQQGEVRLCNLDAVGAPASSEDQGSAPDADAFAARVVESMREVIRRDGSYQNKNVWLTAALIDLDMDPLPPDAASIFQASSTASMILERYADRLIGGIKTMTAADEVSLPRDRRLRLQLALAVLSDGLHLRLPVRLHDEHYQKHKRLVRRLGAIIESWKAG